MYINRAEATKDWCKDMMDKYTKYWSTDDKIYKDLYQFYNDNHVTGIIYKSTSQQKKEKWLSSVAIKINQMFNEITNGV